MSLVTVCSVRGAPGVTTTSLLLAGYVPDGLLVEADVTGGVLAVRYGLGREPGLTTFAAAGSLEPDAWRDHAQPAGGVPVLVGPDAPDRAVALWVHAGRGLAEALAGSSATVVADLGRVQPNQGLAPLLAASGLVVLVRPEAEDLVGLSHRLPALVDASRWVGVVVVGSGVYGPGEVSGSLGVDVLGTLPVDRRAAGLLVGARGGSPRTLGRSVLARAARSLAEEVLVRLDDTPGTSTPESGLAMSLEETT